MKKPFFARFLENQLPETDSHTLQGGQGPGPVTNKYPSDGDDTQPPITNREILDIIEPNTTQKIPSDQEEGWLY